MHSSRPDWVFGLARLISSTSTTFANTGPGRNSKRASRWLKTLVPTTSAGSRSAVHWMRAYSASTLRARARASAVLPTPGLSSISTCPSATTLTSRSLSAPSGALTALATFAEMRAPSAATPSGSSSGTVDMGLDDLTGAGVPAVQLRRRADARLEVHGPLPRGHDLSQAAVDDQAEELQVHRLRRRAARRLAAGVLATRARAGTAVGVARRARGAVAVVAVLARTELVDRAVLAVARRV